MSVPSSRLQPLASAAFVGAAALLVVNDFVFKSLFHNALTGKISDFAGLFAVALFAAALWPRRRALCGVAIAAGFAWWKTEHAEFAIGWLNDIMPFAVGRTVDLTDLVALPAIAVGLWAAPRVRPWPLPRSAQVALAILAPLAFTATSRVDHLTRATTIALPSTLGSEQESAVQGLLDALARERGLRCEVCEPLGDGRVYASERAGDIRYLTANYTADTGAVFVEIRSSPSRSGRRAAEQLTADLHAALGQQFPGLGALEVTTGYPPAAAFTVEVRVDPEQQTAEAAKRALSQVIEGVVSTHGLETDWDAPIYYAGKRLGPTAEDRDLILRAWSYSHSAFWVTVVRRSDGYEPLQRAVATDVDSRLRAAFGSTSVEVQASPWVR